MKRDVKKRNIRKFELYGVLVCKRMEVRIMIMFITEEAGAGGRISLLLIFGKHLLHPGCHREQRRYRCWESYSYSENGGSVSF